MNQFNCSGSLILYIVYITYVVDNILILFLFFLMFCYVHIQEREKTNSDWVEDVGVLKKRTVNTTASAAHSKNQKVIPVF